MDILKKMKNLKWIHYGSTGTDQEIINYSKNKKIKISNSKKLFDYSVASTALAFILCLSRGIHYSLYYRGKDNHGRSFYNTIYQNMNVVFKKNFICWLWQYCKKNIKICKSMGMEIFIIKRNQLKK